MACEGKGGQSDCPPDDGTELWMSSGIGQTQPPASGILNIRQNSFHSLAIHISVFATKHEQLAFLNFGVPVQTKHSVSGCCNSEEAGCLCPSQKGVQAGARHLLRTPGFARPSHCSLQENSRDKVCFQNQGFRAGTPTPTCVVPALTANSDWCFASRWADQLW